MAAKYVGNLRLPKTTKNCFGHKREIHKKRNAFYVQKRKRGHLPLGKISAELATNWGAGSGRGDSKSRNARVKKKSRGT